MSELSYGAQRRLHFLKVVLGPIILALIFLVFHYLHNRAGGQ